MMKCTQDISQVSQTRSNNTRKEKLDLKQVIESNRVQEKFKSKNWHKAITNTRYLFRGSSHRSTPRLHLREGFPLSTEDDYNGLPKTRAPSSTTYKTSTEEVSPQEQEEEQEWSQ